MGSFTYGLGPSSQTSNMSLHFITIKDISVFTKEDFQARIRVFPVLSMTSLPVRFLSVCVGWTVSVLLAPCSLVRLYSLFCQLGSHMASTCLATGNGDVTGYATMIQYVLEADYPACTDAEVASEKRYRDSSKFMVSNFN